MPDTAPQQVTLDIDEDKMEAWDAVKDDYATEVDGGPSEPATPDSPADPEDTRDAPG